MLREGVSGASERRGFLRGIGSALALGTTATLSSCGVSPAISLNLKITVFTEEDGAETAHSGVWQYIERKISAFPNPGQMLDQTLIGDAIPIKLSDGQLAFLLLVEGDDSDSALFRGLWPWRCRQILERGYGVSLRWKDNDCPGLRQLKARPPAEATEIPSTQMPAFVRFTDLGRPETGKVVAPFSLSGAEIGSARVTRATLQAVNSPVTRGIVGFLPWLRNSRQSLTELPSWNNLAKHPEYFSR
jgi:hypothetical protein